MEEGDLLDCMHAPGRAGLVIGVCSRNGILSTFRKTQPYQINADHKSMKDDCLSLISVSLLFSMLIFSGVRFFPFRELAP
jgi:hypothetical protein